MPSPLLTRLDDTVAQIHAMQWRELRRVASALLDGPAPLITRNALADCATLLEANGFAIVPWPPGHWWRIACSVRDGWHDPYLGESSLEVIGVQEHSHLGALILALACLHYAPDFADRLLPEGWTSPSRDERAEVGRLVLEVLYLLHAAGRGLEAHFPRLIALVRANMPSRTIAEA